MPDDPAFERPFGRAIWRVENGVGHDQVVRRNTADIAERQRHVLRRRGQRPPQVVGGAAGKGPPPGPALRKLRGGGIVDVDMGKARRVRIVAAPGLAALFAVAQDAGTGDDDVVRPGQFLDQRRHFGAVDRLQRGAIGPIRHDAAMADQLEPFPVDLRADPARIAHRHRLQVHRNPVLLMRIGIVEGPGRAPPHIGDQGAAIGHPLTFVVSKVPSPGLKLFPSRN